MVDRNSAPEEFTCIWQSKRVGIITINTEKIWIPVVSWSLYFGKASLYSFRADSILKSDGDFISNWKFPDCVHFFGAWARQAVIETIAVVYEHTKRAHEMCSPIGHNHTQNHVPREGHYQFVYHWGTPIWWRSHGSQGIGHVSENDLLGTIIQSIFCAQSGAGICLNYWK